jgi:ABC-type Fe3+-siderophore transport system permease subunit
MNRLSGRKILAVSLGLLILWILVALVSLNIGSVPIPVRTALRLLTARITGNGFEDDPQASVLISVRLPRVLLGSLWWEAALALAGARIQSLLRNPLADPYFLGVSLHALPWEPSSIPSSPDGSDLAASTEASSMGGRWPRSLAPRSQWERSMSLLRRLVARHQRKFATNLLLAGCASLPFLSSVNVFLLTSNKPGRSARNFLLAHRDAISRLMDSSIYTRCHGFLVLAGIFSLLYAYSFAQPNLIGMGEDDASDFLGMK